MPGPEKWKKMNAGARVQKVHIVSCMNERFEISVTYCMSIYEPQCLTCWQRVAAAAAVGETLWKVKFFVVGVRVTRNGVFFSFSIKAKHKCANVCLLGCDGYEIDKFMFLQEQYTA